MRSSTSKSRRCSYWATAVAFELFGQHAWTVRLWPALSGLLGLLLTFALGRRLYDQRAALLAVLVQASALLYVALARIATLDMGLSFGAADGDDRAGCCWCSGRDRARRRVGAAALRCRCCWASGVALAVLSKGLVGILIPGAVAVLYMLIHRDWRLLLRAQPWWTLAVLLLLAAPWFVAGVGAQSRVCAFLLHLRAFPALPEPRRLRPLPAGLVLHAGAGAGLSALDDAAAGERCAQAWRAARAGERASSLLLLWAVFVFVFFSLSQSKLVALHPADAAGAEPADRTRARRPAPPRLASHLRAVALACGGDRRRWCCCCGRRRRRRRWSRAPRRRAFCGFAGAFGLLALGAALGAAPVPAAVRVLGAAAAAAVGALAAGAVRCCSRPIDLPRMRTVVNLAQQLRAWVTRATPLLLRRRLPAAGAVLSAAAPARWSAIAASSISACSRNPGSGSRI